MESDIVYQWARLSEELGVAKRFGDIGSWLSAAVTLSIILYAPAFSWSWGTIGHRVSARLAESRLTPSTLAAVKELLGSRTHLADISTWADMQSEITDTASWHFVNVPITATLYDSKFCIQGSCVVNKIEDFKRTLRDPASSETERNLALKFLVHLIQDLHQPLHVGDTRSKGGNLIQVRFFGEGSNLHRLWDYEIIEWHSKDESLWLHELVACITPFNALEWSGGDEVDWANESLSIAKTAYSLPGSHAVIRSGTRLGEEYCRFALPIIRQQLARAAIRTAAVLNAIFDPHGIRVRVEGTKTAK
jgi:hypothetical protein